MSLTKQLFSRMWTHVQNKFDEMVGNKPVSEQINEAVSAIEIPEASPAIVDVTALPETGEPGRLYRLLIGTFYWNGSLSAYTICHIVEQFPETGTPAIDTDTSQTWMYYSRETQTLMGYIDETLSTFLGTPVGWHPAETLFQVLGCNYGGIVFDPADATESGTMYLVLEGVLYEYADRWIDLNRVGWRGQGDTSEIFNSRLNQALGNYSHAEGFNTIAGKDGSHAEGRYSHAEGYYSHAEGDYSHAEGDYSHAEGSDSHAEGVSSHAEGGSNHAEGSDSHAEGYSSHAEGDYSHAEGRGENFLLKLSGDANATTYIYDSTPPSQMYIGMTARMRRDNEVGITYTTARVVSFDVNAKTITFNRTLSDTAVARASARFYYAGMALGDNSHVEGRQNIAAGRSQHVQGEFNDWDPNYVMGQNEDRAKYADIVGNGTSHTNRSNAYALDWNGNAYYAGNVYVAGNGKNDFAGAKKVATEDYVDSAIPTIPTNVSAFTNDAGYLTQHQSLAGYATEDYVEEFVQDEVGMAAAISAQNVTTSISTHNTATDAHNDIRLLIEGLNTRLNALADSDDTTLDQMSEIIAYIKSNKSLIESVTTSKVNVADIVDNLTTNVANKPLSAAQGVALKALIDEIECVNSNLVNGSAEGSVRSFYSAEESEDYIIGEGSFALGYGSQAPASGAFALGSGCLVEGGGSVAEGVGVYIYGESAHAEGDRTSVLSEFSHAEGTETFTRGYAAHAEGGRNAAIGDFSHTEGEGTAASGDVSHAEGYGERLSITISSYGDPYRAVYQYHDLEDPSILKVGMVVSMTEPFYITDSELRRGANKITSIDTSTQTFKLKKALSGDTALVNQEVYLHISGIAYGEGSHVEGGFNIAAGANQHVEGYCNVADPLYDYTNSSSRGKYIHIAGNGEYNDRSNAHALDWNGNAYYAGDVYVTGDGKNDFAGAKKVATEEYVDEAVTRAEIPQSNWSQNDPTAKDYVKNRTHWDEYEIVTFPDRIDYVTSGESVAGGAGIRYAAELISQDKVYCPALVSGESYTVMWNGVAYTSTCVELSEEGTTFYLLGNLSALGIDTPDADKPFGMAITTDKEGATIVVSMDASTEPTISITGPVRVTHKLDSRFLPNSNILNGSAEDSLRSAMASREDDEYTMGGKSIALGYNSCARGQYGVALGYGSDADGEDSFAVGSYAQASGRHSVALGPSTYATQSGSAALGYGAKCRGEMAVAVGTDAEALATNTHAFGFAAVAKGTGSTALGHEVIASGIYQTAIGKYNVEDSLGTYSYIVGNGTSGTNRKNAMTIANDGTTWFQGDVYVGSTSGTNKDAGSKKLATEDFVTAALTALGLPVPTAADAGKILRVNAEGKYELVALTNAEEATF